MYMCECGLIRTRTVRVVLYTSLNKNGYLWAKQQYNTEAKYNRRVVISKSKVRAKIFNFYNDLLQYIRSVYVHILRHLHFIYTTVYCLILYWHSVNWSKLSLLLIIKWIRKFMEQIVLWVLIFFFRDYNLLVFLSGTLQRRS